MEYYWWAVIAIAFFLVEITTAGFGLAWFGLGAVLAGILELLGVHSLSVQIAVFIGVSVVLLIATRRINRKLLTTAPPLETNLDALVGKTGIVTEEIHNDLSTGRVTVVGQDWMARSETKNGIIIGSKVRVLRYDGAKLIVSEIENS